MQKISQNIRTTLTLLFSIFIINGCVAKNADGTYPTTYSYHPYNKNPQSNSNRPPSNRPPTTIGEQPWTQSNTTSPKVKSVLNLAVAQMGKTYKWAATGPDMFDCSGFTTFVYKENGISLPRTAQAQSEVGQRVNYQGLKEGDLIFFRSPQSSRISHTGIYLGNHQFIHASSSKKKVVRSRLNSGYYRENFQWGKRFFK
jgi:cell wall-associated NlpC family hydrolase